MKPTSIVTKNLPLKIVGGTSFGRYPKISIEQTFNMLVSDDWLVNFAGYKRVTEIDENGEGRGIYGSNAFGHLIVVINNDVYAISRDLGYFKVASIETAQGDVFIDENNAGQIAICDKKDIYIYDYINGVFNKAATSPASILDFLPGYVAFQDTYFIAPDQNSATWRLSDNNDGFSWPSDAQHTGEFQTKPDRPRAILRLPGRGNNLLIFGGIGTEAWSDVGLQLFPYQKNTNFNIDYGTANAATIAANENIVVWLALNEKSGATIMYSEGGEPQQISNDGINFKLANLTAPEKAYGFLFRQDGHLIYQITFPEDNLTYAYDFNTQLFFTLTDENMNFHIAKRVVFFNGNYYFISFKDGHVYELNSKFTTYDGKEIPRVRVCPTVSLPDRSRFVINNLTFPIEQGEAHNEQRIDFSMSKDGGQSFGSYLGKTLNTMGHRPNRFNYWQAGAANEFIPQFRFWGFDRFVATNGEIGIYQ